MQSMDSGLERDQVIDIVKGFGILAVVLGHLKPPFMHYIYSFHMPLFFIVAGMTLKDGPSFVQRSFRRLMVPYFTFVFFGLIVGLCQSTIAPSESVDLMANLKGMLYTMHGMDYIIPYTRVLWFLPALFWARLLLFKFQNTHGAILIPITIALSALSTLKIPFGLSAALLALPMVAFGMKITAQEAKNKLLLILAIISYYLMVVDPPFVNMAGVMTGGVPDYFIFPPLATIAIIGIARAFEKQLQPLATVGKHSLFIFLVHPYTNAIATSLTTHWLVACIISLSLLLAIRCSLNLAQRPGLFLVKE